MIFTNNEMVQSGFSISQIKRSINGLLKNYIDNMVWTKGQPFVSGFVDMSPVRIAYLTCSGLGNFNTLSLFGDRSIIKKIFMNGNPGDVIYDQSRTGMDYLDCSHQTLVRISLQLRDNYGRTLNVHGIHWSFSLVFSRVQNGT